MYQSTAHARTSRLPTKISIAGSFAPGKNTLKTFNPQLSFLMEEHEGHFFQTAVFHKPNQGTRRSEEIGLVIGSATKGQTYLYWERDRLYELPVSYWSEFKTWVNSPGYVDGSADFDRPVTPRCLECHATFFQVLSPASSDNRFNRENFVLGISCERCHGDAEQHIALHSNGSSGTTPQRMPPVGMPREKEIEVCAQCHGGVGRSLTPAFSFQPGESLAQYISLPKPAGTEPIDVHGNQVALLERSRCFQQSPALTCSTCHQLHAPEKAAETYSAVCMKCHKKTDCGMSIKTGPQFMRKCIDCHMPVQASRQLGLDADDKTTVGAKVRSHWIRVYP